MPVVPLDYIEVDDRGVAKLIGTRTKVMQIVMDQMLGYSPEQMREEHPHLSLAQIHAALAYYHAHKDQVDAQIEDSRRFVEQMRAAHPNRFTRAELVARWKARFPDRPVPGEDQADGG
jgi:uncharacterized protein (DUF433 family)